MLAMSARHAVRGRWTRGLCACPALIDFERDIPMPRMPENIKAQLDSVTEEERKFESALGRFTLTWADAEAQLYRVLVRYAGVTDAVGRAIFSGTRAGAMMDYVRSIAHNTKLDAQRVDDLEFVFGQLKTINTMRDHVTHFGSAELLIWREPDKRVVSNVERVSRIGKHFTKEVGSQTLDDMTFDLQGIINHLGRHWTSTTDAFFVWEENKGEGTTWRFRPEQPIVDRPTNDRPASPVRRTARPQR
jgi:hypothetical protein